MADTHEGREQVQQFDEVRWAYVFPDGGHITLRERGWKPESDDPRWQCLRVVSQSNWSDNTRLLAENARLREVLGKARGQLLSLDHGHDLLAAIATIDSALAAVGEGT